jgi:hypothetical protein
VGVVWRPKVFLPTNFSLKETKDKIVVLQPQYASVQGKSVPSAASITVMNVASLVAEMVALGEGCIDDVIFR